MIDDKEKSFKVFSIDAVNTKKPEQFLYLEERNIYFFVRIPIQKIERNIYFYFCNKISITDNGLVMKIFITDKVNHEKSWFFGEIIETDTDYFWNNQRDLYQELNKNVFKYNNITEMVNRFLSTILKKNKIKTQGKFTSFTKPFRDVISKDNLFKIVDIILEQPSGYIEENNFNKISLIPRKQLKGLKIIGKIELPEKAKKKKNGKKTKEIIIKTPLKPETISREVVKNIITTRKGSDAFSLKRLVSKRNMLITLLVEKNLFVDFQEKTKIKHGNVVQTKRIIVTNSHNMTVTSTIISRKNGTLHLHKNDLMILVLNKVIDKIQRYNPEKILQTEI